MKWVFVEYWSVVFDLSESNYQKILKRSNICNEKGGDERNLKFNIYNIVIYSEATVVWGLLE